MVTILKETARGCGYRKAGPTGVGIYLMGEGIFRACERLPFPLGVCPCCGLPKSRQSRGFTWLQPHSLFAKGNVPTCLYSFPHDHDRCRVCSPLRFDNKAGLLWVGNKYYSADSFVEEAREMGVSKRIGNIPLDLEVGKDAIFLAHPQAIKAKAQLEGDPEGKGKPGIFMVFVPSHIDLVIDDENDIPDRAHELLEKHESARLVKIIRDEPVQQGLFDQGGQ